MQNVMGRDYQTTENSLPETCEAVILKSGALNLFAGKLAGTTKVIKILLQLPRIAFGINFVMKFSL
jgi:hypothetical protein